MKRFQMINYRRMIQIAGLIAVAFALLSTADAPHTTNFKQDIYRTAQIRNSTHKNILSRAWRDKRNIERQHLTLFIASRNPKLNLRERNELIPVILEQAARLQIPAHMRIDARSVDRIALLTAFISVESTFKRSAVSRSNARGYMQLKPSTVAWLDHKQGRRSSAHRLFETRINLMRGVDYINHLAGLMQNLRKTCLAYNAGPGSVQKGRWHESYWRHILREYRKIMYIKSATKKSGPGLLANK